jgi:hypothetical protein
MANAYDTIEHTDGSLILIVRDDIKAIELPRQIAKNVTEMIVASDDVSIRCALTLAHKLSPLRKLDISNADVSTLENLSALLRDIRDKTNSCMQVDTVMARNWYAPNLTSLNGAFTWISDAKRIDLSGLFAPKLETMAYACEHMTELQHIDLSYAYAPALDDLSHCFADCTALRHINLEGAELARDYRTYKMLYDCASVERIDTNPNMTKGQLKAGSIKGHPILLTVVATIVIFLIAKLFNNTLVLAITGLIDCFVLFACALIILENRSRKQDIRDRYLTSCFHRTLGTQSSLTLILGS